MDFNNCKDFIPGVLEDSVLGEKFSWFVNKELDLLARKSNFAMFSFIWEVLLPLQSMLGCLHYLVSLGKMGGNVN